MKRNMGAAQVPSCLKFPNVMFAEDIARVVYNTSKPTAQDIRSVGRSVGALIRKKLCRVVVDIECYPTDGHLATRYTGLDSIAPEHWFTHFPGPFPADDGEVVDAEFVAPGPGPLFGFDQEHHRQQSGGFLSMAQDYARMVQAWDALCAENEAHKAQVLFVETAANRVVKVHIDEQKRLLDEIDTLKQEAERLSFGHTDKVQELLMENARLRLRIQSLEKDNETFRNAPGNEVPAINSMQPQSRAVLERLSGGPAPPEGSA